MDVLRVGKISSVNAEEGKCRVVYSDRDDCTTVELPLIVFNNEYYVPEVDDQVLVLHQPNGSASAFILGDYWSQTHETPDDADEKYRWKGFDRDDKCYWEYLGNDDGTLHLKNEDKIKVESDDDIEISSKTNLKLSGDNTVKVNSDGSIEIQSSGALKITGGTVTITGSAKIDGITFISHTHECTAPGSPSGPPQGA